MTKETPWYETVVIPGLLRHARTAYGASMRRALAAEGYDDIPGNGLYVIGGLALNGDTPLGMLIDQLRISKQSASVLVDTLVERGYLGREPDPADRRRVSLTLTEKGRAAAAVQAGAREWVDDELARRVSVHDIRAMRRALAALCGIGREVADAG